MFKLGSIIKYTLILVFLIFLQVGVLNKISLFDLATPIIYIYLIIKLPIALNRNVVVIIGFILGFIIDIFSNTPGINAAATTLMAFMRPWVYNLFFVVEDFEEQVPKLSTQGFVFIKCVVMLVFIHHLALFTLESFSLFNLPILLGRIIASTLLSSLLIITFESFGINKKHA